MILKASPSPYSRGAQHPQPSALPQQVQPAARWPQQHRAPHHHLKKQPAGSCPCQTCRVPLKKSFNLILTSKKWQAMLHSTASAQLRAYWLGIRNQLLWPFLKPQCCASVLRFQHSPAYFDMPITGHPATSPAWTSVRVSHCPRPKDIC